MIPSIDFGLLQSSNCPEIWEEELDKWPELREWFKVEHKQKCTHRKEDEVLQCFKASVQSFLSEFTVQEAEVVCLSLVCNTPEEFYQRAKGKISLDEVHTLLEKIGNM